MEPSQVGGADVERSLTQVIAERMRHLRQSLRLSGADLADRMQSYGVPWTRTTVAKLETGRRDVISVSELVALGLALDVPPVWLIADPESKNPVHLAEGVEVPPAVGFLWFMGKRRITDRAEQSWTDARLRLDQFHAVNEIWSALEGLERSRSVTPLPTPEQESAWVEITTQQLEKLGWHLSKLEQLKAPMPLPAWIIDRAKELGVPLPGYTWGE